MQSPHRFTVLFYLFAIVIVGYALYLFNPFQYYFLNDDLIHIPLSKNGEFFQRQSFRPIGDLSVQIDYLIWGKNAWGYHLTNLLLHIFNAVLVFILAKTLFKKYAPAHASTTSGALVSLLFFVYAFHSESIFWILGRSASLGTLFFIPGLIFYLKRSAGTIKVLLSLLFFELGLLAYESVWIFPFVIFTISFLDYKLCNTNTRKEVNYIGLVLGVFFIHLIIRYQVINQFAASYEAAAFIQTNYPVLIMNFLKLLGRGFIPPVNYSKILAITIGLLSFLFMLFYISQIIQKRKNVSTSFSGWVLVVMLIALTPYLSLGINTHNVEGERYLYLPSIFFCMFWIIGIQNISSKNLRFIILGIIFSLHLYFLSISATNYKAASKIVQTTINQINLLEGKKHLFIDSLPQSYKGALIFRLGFEKGVAWLKNANTVEGVVVLSIKEENTSWSDNYKVTAIGEKANVFIKSILLHDTIYGQAYMPKNIINYQFNNKTDAWFIFKNDVLEVIK